MKTIIAIFTAMLIIGTGAYPREMSADHSSTLNKVAAFAVDEQLPIHSWKVMMKENILHSEALKLKNELINRINLDDVSYDESTNASKIIFRNTQKNEAFIESFILIVPKDSKNYAEIVYVVEGRGTPKLTEKNNMEINTVKGRYFSGNVTIFSCIQVKSSDIIDDVLVYEKFKDTFDITTIDEVTENGWISRTGLTKQWDQRIPTAGGEMNVQYASRTLGGGTNITIGTPIITAEY